MLSSEVQTLESMSLKLNPVNSTKLREFLLNDLDQKHWLIDAFELN